jgi:cytochrome c556
MHNSPHAAKFLAALIAATLLGACDKPVAPAAPPSGTGASLLKPTAGIQDIMAGMIEPSAEFVWESVSSTVTAEGVEDKQPRIDEEWNEVRRHAMILTESANLLLIDGRHVTRDGRQLDDHGTPGNLTVEQVEQAIATERASFVGFSHALHDVGAALVKAADEKDVQAIMNAGETLDEVCESCHLKFWYPGQKIPPLPDQAPETN